MASTRGKCHVLDRSTFERVDAGALSQLANVNNKPNHATTGRCQVRFTTTKGQSVSAA